MDLTIRDDFRKKWEKYFPGSDLPLACYYADNISDTDYPKAPSPNKKGYTCIFSQLAPVRSGKSRAFDQGNLGCMGATETFGFGKESTESEMEQKAGFIAKTARLKKTEEHARSMFTENPPQPAQGKHLIFKRWDQLSETDEPQVVFFFCTPDALAGLHALANFDVMGMHGVIAPFGSGCSSLIGFAMQELQSDTPRAVLGFFDPAARECVKSDLLTFSVPWPKFVSMVANMDDCFLNTFLWENTRKRMQKR